jgi:hypothetical protein
MIDSIRVDKYMHLIEPLTVEVNLNYWLSSRRVFGIVW